jgi:DNA replication and repair protein RecF
MQIEKLLLVDFRSCAQVTLEPGPGINVLVGGNAQGKSTLLEAVYLLATSRSPRAGKDVELIRWGQEFATASVEVLREDRGEVGVEVSLSRTDRRVMRVNGVRRPRVADVVGQLNAVLFTTADLDIIRGEPSLRRRFLNLEISQVSPQYCHALLKYRRILEQRNRLLKSLRDCGGSVETLDAWNEQLIAVGARMMERRRTFTQDLGRHAQRIYQEIAGAGEDLEVRYLPSFPIEAGEDIASLFRSRLEEVRQDELARGITLIGPHRDDLGFQVKGTDVRVFGSQGQQRSVALSTKLAEVELMRERVGEAPVLLLDDAGAELDEARRARLFDAVRESCQTLVTCTDEAMLPAEMVRNAQRYRVEEGRVARGESVATIS